MTLVEEVFRFRETCPRRGRRARASVFALPGGGARPYTSLSELYSVATVATLRGYRWVNYGLSNDFPLMSVTAVFFNRGEPSVFDQRFG